MKVSLYVGDDTWIKFRKAVLRKTGDPRALSSEVQGLIEDAIVDERVAAAFQKMKISSKGLSSTRVVPVKPSVATSAESILREMRGGRHDKAVSRQ